MAFLSCIGSIADVKYQGIAATIHRLTLRFVISCMACLALSGMFASVFAGSCFTTINTRSEVGFHFLASRSSSISLCKQLHQRSRLVGRSRPARRQCNQASAWTARAGHGVFKKVPGLRARPASGGCSLEQATIRLQILAGFLQPPFVAERLSRASRDSSNPRVSAQTPLTLAAMLAIRDCQHLGTVQANQLTICLAAATGLRPPMSICSPASLSSQA